MPLLNNVVNLLTQLNRANLTITPNRCTKVRHRLSSCTKCATVCPGQAISIVDNEFKILPENCTQCGACATACPTDAIAAKAPSDFELVQAVIDHIAALRAERSGAADSIPTSLRGAPGLGATRQSILTFAFACTSFVEVHKKQLDQSNIIELPCLARLSESILLAIAHQLLQVHGSVVPIYLLRHDCKDCPNKAVLGIMHQTTQNLASLLAAWSLPSIDQFLTITAEMPTQFTSERGKPNGR